MSEIIEYFSGAGPLLATTAIGIGLFLWSVFFSKEDCASDVDDFIKNLDAEDDIAGIKGTAEQQRCEIISLLKKILVEMKNNRERHI